MLEIFEFIQTLNTAQFVPVSVFIPMLALIGCLAGLCLYFFVKYKINLHDRQRLEAIRFTVKNRRQETTVTRAIEFTPAGTLLSTRCSGYDEIGNYANGIGGTYEKIIASKSPKCGHDVDLYSHSTAAEQQIFDSSPNDRLRRRASDHRREQEEQERRRRDSDNNDAMQFESQMSLARAMALNQASSDDTPNRRDTSCDSRPYVGSTSSQDTTTYTSSDSGGSSDSSSVSCD